MCSTVQAELETCGLSRLHQLNGASRVHIPTGVAISQSEFHAFPHVVRAFSSSGGPRRLYRREVHRPSVGKQADEPSGCALRRVSSRNRLCLLSTAASYSERSRIFLLVSTAQTCRPYQHAQMAMAPCYQDRSGTSFDAIGRNEC